MNIAGFRPARFRLRPGRFTQKRLKLKFSVSLEIFKLRANRSTAQWERDSYPHSRRRKDRLPRFFTLGMETTTAGKDVSQIDYVTAAKAALPQLAGADVIVALAQFPLAPKTPSASKRSPQIDVVLREKTPLHKGQPDVTMLPDGRFAVAPRATTARSHASILPKSLDGKWKATHEKSGQCGCAGRPQYARITEQVRRSAR